LKKENTPTVSGPVFIKQLLVWCVLTLEKMEYEWKNMAMASVRAGYFSAIFIPNWMQMSEDRGSAEDFILLLKTESGNYN
jgi:hypothetical protein